MPVYRHFVKTSECSPKMSLNAYWKKMSVKVYWDYLGLLVGSFFYPTLEPLCSISYHFHCRKPGLEKRLLIFEFDGFSIGRTVSVVVSKEVWEAGPAPVETRNKWIIPGVKPQR